MSYKLSRLPDCGLAEGSIADIGRSVIVPKATDDRVDILGCRVARRLSVVHRVH